MRQNGTAHNIDYKKLRRPGQDARSGADIRFVLLLHGLVRPRERDRVISGSYYRHTAGEFTTAHTEFIDYEPGSVSISS